MYPQLAGYPNGWGHQLTSSTDCGGSHRASFLAKSSNLGARFLRPMEALCDSLVEDCGLTMLIDDKALTKRTINDLNISQCL